MNWNNITKNEKVKALLIERIYIEQEIKRLDKNALIYELEALTIPVAKRTFRHEEPIFRWNLMKYQPWHVW